MFSQTCLAKLDLKNMFCVYLRKTFVVSNLKGATIITTKQLTENLFIIYKVP